MIKLLWIDDNLDHDLTEKRMALYMEDDLDPHFARDATEAFYRLRDEPFDVVIFDLRLPPGPDDMWNDLRKQDFWQYGVELLKMVSTGLKDKFINQANAKFGVFSIEAPGHDHDIFCPPINLPPNNFMKKTDAYYEEDFINFIRNVAKS
jgi:hypothetical protein